MSLIITATDFSDIATNAVHYACELAKDQDAELIIIHSFSVPIMFNDSPMPVSFINDTQEDAQDQMNVLLIDLYKKYPTLNVKGHVVFGEIIDAVDEYVTENVKPWMIIVGNSTGNEQVSWPDSTLIEAFQSLKYPVLAVPPGVSYNGIKNLCFAFDNKHNGNITAMLRLADIKQKLNAELQVINVQTDSNTADKTEIDPIVKNLLSPADPQYNVIVDSDVNNAIESYITGNNIDMLIMIPRKHSFFEGLFHKSHTKAVAHRIQIPILALHDA